MANMRIRKARLSDATGLAKLSEVLGYPVEAKQIGERLKSLLGRKDHAVLATVSQAGLVVGWIHATEQLVLESGPSCEILGLVVDANQRGHGIGRQLVEQVEEWALDRGLHQITVRSNIIRVESHPFYERLGYTRVKTQHAYRKALQRGFCQFRFSIFDFRMLRRFPRPDFILDIEGMNRESKFENRDSKIFPPSLRHWRRHFRRRCFI